MSGKNLEKFILDKNIRAILNLTGSHEEKQWYLAERQIAERNHVKLYDIGLSPHNLPEYRELVFILNILLEGDKPLLIHCRRGSDRSGLVSALALAIEEDPPFSRLREQYSWKYGVLPFYRSVGPYFFSLYTQWLIQTQKAHSRDALLYWIRNEYFDCRKRTLHPEKTAVTGRSPVTGSPIAFLCP